MINNPIDKDFTFIALCDGYTVDVTIHLTLDHNQVMSFGKLFCQMTDKENNEVNNGYIKDLLDKTEADSIAKSLFGEWDQEEEERTVDDFYDEAYDTLAFYFYGYQWSPEFKNDCINYYRSHQ